MWILQEGAEEGEAPTSDLLLLSFVFLPQCDGTPGNACGRCINSGRKCDLEGILATFNVRLCSAMNVGTVRALISDLVFHSFILIFAASI